MFSRWFYAYYSILKKITKLTESAFENQWICFEIGLLNSKKNDVQN